MEWRHEMEAGADVISMLKRNLFPAAKWHEVGTRLAIMLCRLKHEARKAKPDMTEIQRMEWLARFTRQDVEDAMAMPDTRPLPKKGSIGSMLALPANKEAKDGHSETQAPGIPA